MDFIYETLGLVESDLVVVPPASNSALFDRNSSSSIFSPWIVNNLPSTSRDEDKHGNEALLVKNVVHRICPNGDAFTGSIDAITGDAVCGMMMCSKTGEVYDGPFAPNSVRHGDGATVSRTDGSRFIGSYRNGVPHKGTWIAPDFTYEGEFKFCSSTSVTRGVSKEKRHSITANDDLPPQLLPPPEIHPCYLFDGIGSLVRRAPHGGVIAYEGEFHKGRMHGVGREKMPDGSLYAGEFLNGYRHGVGTLFEINLETYQSENKTDDGSDKYTREKENTKDLSCFSGVWSHGKLVGKDEGNEVEQNWATSIKWSGKCVDAFDKS